MSFWVARLQTNRANLALHFPNLAGYTTYFPCVASARRLGATEPLFVGCLFIVACDCWREAHYTPGLLKLLMYGERPAVVADDVVAAIKARERNGLVVLPRPPRRVLLPGEHVRVPGTSGLVRWTEFASEDTARGSWWRAAGAYCAERGAPRPEVRGAHPHRERAPPCLACRAGPLKQINIRKIDGWQTLATAPVAQPIDLAA
jgi:hypothetical protein